MQSAIIREKRLPVPMFLHTDDIMDKMFSFFFFIHQTHFQLCNSINKQKCKLTAINTQFLTKFSLSQCTFHSLLNKKNIILQNLVTFLHFPGMNSFRGV